MNAVLMKPQVQKWVRYFLAYVLFALFAILGLEVIVNLHSAFFRISLMATSLFGFSNFVYVWGGFFLFAIYTVSVVLLESLMNQTAKNGNLLRVGTRVFAVEFGLAVLALLLPVVAGWIFLPK